MTDPTESEIEAIARAYCKAMGIEVVDGYRASHMYFVQTPLVSEIIRARLALDAAIAEVRGDCVNVARDLAMKEVRG